MPRTAHLSRLLTLPVSVAQAKTGTGKTLAFLLPLLQRMINDDPSIATRGAKYTARSDDIRGIIMSPTRELAEQIAEEARRLTRHTGLVIQTAVGGTSKGAMLRNTRRHGCHLLVATPGRLHDLLSDSESGIAAPNLSALVLDEADRMLDVGFERELNKIIDLLPRPEEKVRQTMLVSATIPDKVIRLTRNMVRSTDFEFVQTIAESDTLTHDRVPQKIVPVTHIHNLFPALFELLEKSIAEAEANPKQRPFKAIVYLNRTTMVQFATELAFKKKRAEGSRTGIYSIHSQLSQLGRTKAADSFRRAASAILFSSDVTARGMDFPDVTHVIQVDCPNDRETYIHRLGRTGRQDKEGEGWLLMPTTNRRNTRMTLEGLPLKPDTSLESASFDPASGEEPPQTIATLNGLYTQLSPSMLSEAYTGILFSPCGNRDEMVAQVNEWAIKGWGWSQPPKVSKATATKQGLGRADLNFGVVERSGRDDDRRRDNFSGDRRRRPDNSDDPFENMSRSIRRDDGGRGRSSGGFRGGSRGGSGGNFRGSSRGGSSRFSRDSDDSAW